MAANDPMFTETHIRRNTVWFAAYIVACTLAFLAPLRGLIHVALSSDTYSHILLVPFVSIVLVWMDRERLFQKLEGSPWSAAVLFCVGALLGMFGWRNPPPSASGDWPSIAIVGFVVLIWAGFLALYGASAFKTGMFPLVFLVLMVPLPGFLLDRFTTWLQVGSADVAELIFHLSGTPVLRQGMIFALPQATIEVAKECSGIRSTEALLITCLVAGHLFLRTSWRRAVLLTAAIPVLVVKNGIRISTLTLLAVRVDPSFLTGRLHRDGGFVFFTLAILILLPLFWWLQKTEAARLHL